VEGNDLFVGEDNLRGLHSRGDAQNTQPSMRQRIGKPRRAVTGADAPERANYLDATDGRRSIQLGDEHVGGGRSRRSRAATRSASRITPQEFLPCHLPNVVLVVAAAQQLGEQGGVARDILEADDGALEAVEIREPIPT